jgi:hypothetical protein
MTTDALFFDDIKEITTEKLYQYDIGQKLKISGFDINENTEVHFKSPYSKIAKIATGTLNGSSLTVVIPDEFLESAGNGKVWVCTIDGNEVTTIRTINIPIVERAKPDGYVSKADGSYRKFNEEIADLNNNKANKEEVSAEISKAKSEAITKADLMIDDYDKTQVQPALAKKADKADTLAGYGITDAYDKKYLDKALKDKLNKMPFDTVPVKNSPNYVTSGTLYNCVNTLNQSIAAKYDRSNFENGTGELSPAQAIYDGNEGGFNYVKNGKVVTVSVNITKLVADKSYIQMAGLPFPAKNESRFSSIAVYSTTNKLRNIRLDGSWLYISSPTDKFAEDEKINFTITYIRQ